MTARRVSNKGRKTDTQLNLFGSSWTEQKLNALCDYTKSYLKIMNKNDFRTIYFDGFAGPGDRLPPSTDDLQVVPLFEETEDGTPARPFPGSPKRILALQGPRFDFYYFVDTNPAHVASLEALKSQYPDDAIHVRSTECSLELRKLSNALKNDRSLRALVFLDPYGLQVKWEDIAQFEGTHIDLWVLIPSGFTLNLAVRKGGHLHGLETLVQYFGLPEEILRREFYLSSEEVDLWGEPRRRTVRLKDVPVKIAGLYVRQLRTIFSHVCESGLELRNSQNTIFHLIFASNNATGLKIAEHLVERANASK